MQDHDIKEARKRKKKYTKTHNMKLWNIPFGKSQKNIVSTMAKSRIKVPALCQRRMGFRAWLCLLRK